MQEEIKKSQVQMLKCVVCAGHGVVNWGKAECHACQGKGYILVNGDRGEVDGGAYEQPKK